MVVLLTSESANLCSVLENIKKGRLERAIVVLERSLDRCITSLGNMRKDAQPTDHETITLALKAVRSYRRSHPRQVETGIGETTALADERGTAQKILEELES